ncbi:MAG: SCO family protein [Gammaproteobacteria bacterium]
MNNSNHSIAREAIWIIPGILIAAIIWLVFFRPTPVIPPELTQATLLPEGRAIQPFQLSTGSGEAFTLENLKGHWSFLFFGYTHCPDICPTTLQDLAASIKIMASTPSSTMIPQVVFISVDPERDNGQQLSDYVQYFNNDFIGVTGSENELLALSRQLGIIYARVEEKSSEDYLVDHSAALLLFDPEGHFRAVFGAPHKADNIAHDLPLIQAWYGLVND